MNTLRHMKESRLASICLEEEPAVVDRARCSPEAFGELYERYCERIYAFAYARLQTRTDAEDATSEVFLALRFTADLSNDTIAAVMGKSTPAIIQLIHGGVHALRAKLAVDEIAGPAVHGDVTAQSVEGAG